MGRVHVFGREGGTIGREKERGHVLRLAEMEVSKAHARLGHDAETDTFSIEDLGSRNGTFVNYERLSEQYVLCLPCFFSYRSSSPPFLRLVLAFAYRLWSAFCCPCLWRLSPFATLWAPRNGARVGDRESSACLRHWVKCVCVCVRSMPFARQAAARR